MSQTLTRPFKPGVDIIDARSLWEALNKAWWIQRIPIFLLAVPASWGVGAYADERYPTGVAAVAGSGFEAVYMGAIAYADQQLGDDRTSKILWWVLNGGAVVSSALINVLYSAGGTFANITPEDVVHGAPLAILNFLYALMLHRNTSKALQAERAAAEVQRLKDEQAEIERKQRAAEERYPCPNGCGRGFATINRLNGHKRHCRP